MVTLLKKIVEPDDNLRFYRSRILQADYKSFSFTGLTQTSFPVCENFSVDWRYET